MRLLARSILLRNRKRGIFSSSSSRRMIWSCGSFFSSASQTTMAASTAGSAARMSLRELHRTRTVDEGVGVAHEGGGGRRERDAHLVMAGFGAGIADGSSVVDGAGAGDCARARQYCFEKSGFTALERAHQCDAPWTAGTSDVLSHSPPPVSGARPLIGSASINALPAPGIWQAGKCRCGASLV